MNRDIGGWLGPLVAIGLFAFVVTQTAGALRESGVWRFGPRPLVAVTENPFTPLDRILAQNANTPPGTSLRDPFGYVQPAPSPGPARTVVRRLTPPAPPAKPVLTAIVYDADPRAILRYKNREWAVRAGDVFDEFSVLQITRDRVILKRGEETLVLQRPSQGE